MSVACLGGRTSRRARLLRWLTAQWRSVALLLLVAPTLLALGMLNRDTPIAYTLILASCAALFTGLVGASANFSFLGFRWQPLVARRQGSKACISADLTRSYLQFAKLVAGPDQVRGLIEHAVHQVNIHCDQLPTSPEKYSFGLCTIVRWVWSMPVVPREQLPIRSSGPVM